MSEGTPYIELRLSLSKPAELLALVGAFTALANQFEQYIKRQHPDLDGQAKLYVRHIHASDIVLELVPLIQNVISSMDAALIVEDFSMRYGSRLKALFEGKKEPASRGDLKDFMNQVAVIAIDPNGKATISSAKYHETKTTKNVIIEFDTKQAKEAESTIKEQKKEIELKALEYFENVFMVFFQSNLKDPDILGPTQEKATIEAIFPKPLSIVYGSDLAKERIKHETFNGLRSIYKLGFYVDVYVERFNGKPVAYKIAAVREIIELPED
jgi:hypothetical protein